MLIRNIRIVSLYILHLIYQMDIKNMGGRTVCRLLSITENQRMNSIEEKIMMMEVRFQQI